MHTFIALFFASAVLFASSAYAHVRVQPEESTAGAHQTYTVRVPTEGKVATSAVEIEIPAGVAVFSASGRCEIKRENGHAVSIIWKDEIPPGQSREFQFDARNPADAAELVWKAHQTFADGTVADWAEEESGSRPAPRTKVIKSK